MTVAREVTAQALREPRAAVIWRLVRDALAAHVDLALLDLPNEVAARVGAG